MKRDHGGNAMQLFKDLVHPAPLPWLDCSTSLSPLKNMVADFEGSQTYRMYPDADASLMVQAMASAHGISADMVLCGNGSTDLISQIIRALWPLYPKLRGVVPELTWSGYAEICSAHSLPCEPLRYRSFANLQAQEIAWLASPNNPDGTLLDIDQVVQWAKLNSQSFYVVDLAFEDFSMHCKDSKWWQYLGQGILPSNIILLKSLTKFFGVAGLRMGFMAANLPTANILKKASLPWQVNSIAQSVATKLYGNWHELAKQRLAINELANEMVNVLQQNDFCVAKQDAWILAEHQKFSGEQIFEEFLHMGICVRLFKQAANIDKQKYSLRFGLLDQEELTVFTSRLNSWKNKTQVLVKNKALPAILVAGTTSDAGKSALATGLCGALKNRGMHPVPFKAQNMSNQAWVTAEGGEMGWSQAVQAFACGVEPHVHMNPILLKPGSERHSHVVLCGKDQGAFAVQEYYGNFDNYKQECKLAYDALCTQKLANGKLPQSVVLEGAGGLAEINLRHRDLSNRVAPIHANANILLVGDIERGGVFASLYGTWACLEASMRARLKGFAINRFRGDASLLESGIKELEERTGVPVLGVVPWQNDLKIGYEDSMGIGDQQLPAESLLRIAVVQLPHLSNVNDFACLENICGVGVYYSADPYLLKMADAIIVPGTRTTIADLQWLKATGIAQVICEFAKTKKPILAVCGGMQMLGLQVSDPHGIESNHGLETKNVSKENGLALLPLQTTMQKTGKVVRPCSQVIDAKLQNKVPWLRGINVARGYEIHCGTTTLEQGDFTPCFDGWISTDGMIWATYWHGILHDAELATQWLQWVAQVSRKPIVISVAISEQSNIPQFLKPGIEVATQLVEKHIRWEQLWTM